MKSAAPVLLTVLTILAATQTSLAQSEAPTEAEKVLASARAIRCTFPVSARTNWRNGAPQPAIRPRGNFIVNIREIKAEAGSAVLAVGAGGKDITLVSSDQNRYFVDVGGARISMTSVIAEFSTDTRLKAIHTQSDFVALEVGSFKSEPDIVHYVGDCEVLP